jgi:hypothetical protein
MLEYKCFTGSQSLRGSGWIFPNILDSHIITYDLSLCKEKSLINKQFNQWIWRIFGKSRSITLWWYRFQMLGSQNYKTEIFKTI